MATKQLSFSVSGMSWTVDFTMSDISVSENQFEFRVPSDCPVVYAKYVCSGKSAAYINTWFGIKTSSATIYNNCWYHENGAWASGAQKQLVDTRIPSTKTLNTSDYFGVFNKTTKIAPMFLYFSEGEVDAGVGTDPEYPFDIQYYNEDEIILNDIARLILDAPPSATVADITKNTSGFYAGITTVSVSISNLTAYYGGDFTTTTEYPAGVKFEIGNQSDERHDNGTLSIALDSAGTFTPKVTVTDSRGQTYVKTFDPITVQEYNPTTNITTLLRVNATGEPEDDPAPGHFSDEGTNAVVACVFDYPIIASNYMKRPVVKINGQSPTNTVNWYTSWTENGGFSGQVSFSSYNPTRPVTLYGKITDTLETDQSYEISVACNTTLGIGSTDAQTLPQAFYLLSAAAGGHGLGIGMKVPEDPNTHKKEGLHVDMDATFYKTTKFRQAPGIIKMYAGNSAPDGWLLCDGSAVSRIDYALLFAVIGTTYGAGDGSTTFNVPDLSGRFALGAGEPNDNNVHAWGDNLTYDGTNKYNEPIGNKGGESKHQLTKNQLPKIQGQARMGWGDSSAAGIMVTETTGDFYSTASGSTYYATGARSGTYYNALGINVGNNEPHNNMPPYTAVNYIISTGEPSENSDSTDLPVVRGVLVDGQSVVENEVASIQASMMLDFFYPVGSYYETSNVNFNPNTDWGGTWDKLDDGLFLQSTHTASKVGTNVSAGLPNITGGGNTCAYGENRGFVVSRWGAFTSGGTYNYKPGSSAYWSTNYQGLQFDASQSNSIYGNSTTVQPPSKLVYIWHRTA